MKAPEKNHYAYALHYAIEHGLPVFPIWHLAIHKDGRLSCGCGDFRGPCVQPGKHPNGLLVKHGHLDATIDPERIRKWWQAGAVPRPIPNIGIPTGASGITIIDVDPRNGGDKSLTELAVQHGEMPPTWTAISGGGGPHYYFQSPATPLKSSASLLAQGIDIKGHGGYAVVPPSLHISQRRYAWAEGCAP
jgi:hypothetical protein